MSLSRPGCLVMGVVNVTPDSFSDGGRYVDPDAAVAHGLRLAADGADLVDVGGESTRPGADRVDADTEAGRVLPVIRALAADGVAVSVDTTRAAVAEAALRAGARMVNDVSGGLADPDMARVVAAAGCPWVLMHWRGHSREMQRLAEYDDVVADVVRELSARMDAAVAAGVAVEQLVLDPGLGFAKTAAHNWTLLARLDAVLALGRPVLVGASRKSFLGTLLAGPDGTARPVEGREAATVATTVLAAQAGAWAVRVHDVRSSADALAVLAAAGQRPAVPAPPAVAASSAVSPALSAVPAPPAVPPAPVDDRISLTGLTVVGHHGVYPQERRDGQEFAVDVVLRTDTRRAAASDDVVDTVHYGDLAERLAAVVAGEPVNLIETLAARLADTCLADDRVAAVEVTVHKPHAPIPLAFTDVAVTLRRERTGSAGGAAATSGGARGAAVTWGDPRDAAATSDGAGGAAGDVHAASGRPGGADS